MSRSVKFRGDVQTHHLVLVELQSHNNGPAADLTVGHPLLSRAASVVNLDVERLRAVWAHDGGRLICFHIEFYSTHSVLANPRELSCRRVSHE